MPNDYSNDRDPQDYGRNYGSGRDYTYSSARDYRAAGEMNDRDDRGDRDDRNFRGGGTGYGGGYRPDNQGGRETYGSGNRDYYGGSNRSGSGQYGSGQYGADRSGQDRYESGNYGSSSYGSYGSDRYGSGRNDRDQGGYGNRSYGAGQNDRGYGQQQYRGDSEYRGAYGSDGHRFTEGQNDRDRNDRDRGDRNRWSTDQFRGGGSQNRDYGRAPQGYDYQERGFIERAGDEVRSWFGDEEAERRREFDQRYDERQNQGRDQNQNWGRSSTSGSFGHDDDYSSWRKSQVDALDRDYHEYRQENAKKYDAQRQENAKKFESEFGSWRTNRQTQRTSLSQVKEHAEVVGSDGEHVGTVDKVRGDRIILTKNDSDAGGRHHSIPSSWLKSVDDKVTISKTAEEAKKHWRDEEESSAMFGDDDRGSTTTTGFGGTTGNTTGTTTAGSTTGGTTTGGTTGSSSYSSSTSTKY